VELARRVWCGIALELAGGADAFATSTLAGFDGLKATSEDKCAPFSKPLGLNLGEGASFVFLETRKSAQERRARVHAEGAGSGMSNDAYHCSSPEPSGRGLARAMEQALKDAGDGTRLILSCGGGVPPGVTTENILAFLDAARL
jgi:3-oxoacyl-(acyl-carrier-protein) synthase